MSQDEREQGGEKYIVFYLGNDLYGTPIRTVREVIEYQPAKPVPNTIDAFEGVINVRGEVMGCMDLRRRFKVPGAKPQCQFVVETEAGPVAVAVDRVEAVYLIPEKDIERQPALKTQEANEFLLGIGKMMSNMVTLVDLSGLLTKEDVALKV